MRAEPSFAFHRGPSSPLEASEACINSNHLHQSLVTAPAEQTAQSSGGASNRAASLPCWEDAHAADARQHTDTAQSSGAASSRAASLPCWAESSAADGHQHVHTAELSGAASNRAEACNAADARQHAYTPQELAEHLEMLKQEFRHICSSLENGSPKHSQHSSGTSVSCPLHSMRIVHAQSPQLRHCCQLVSNF